MGIRARVRQMLGPLERPVSDLYRTFFVDVGQLVRTVRKWVPRPTNILEIGCGEGAVCERLIQDFPHAAVTGIDITSRVGRLFRGDRSRIRFARATAEEWTSRHPASFDLMLMCDVLHHVPWDQHITLLRQASQMLKPGGVMVLKDWLPLDNMVHLLAEFSDRVLTGDNVRFGSELYFRQLLENVFGKGSIEEQTWIRPWRNNFAFLVSPT